MTDITEEWRPVVGFEGRYEVSDQGRVRNGSGHVLTQVKHLGGYRQVHLYADGQRTVATVHSVVLSTFVRPRQTGEEALHLNNIPDDNRLANLCWGTKQENERQKIRDGRTLRGAANPVAKLTEADVRAIRARPTDSLQDLADEYGCTFSNISAIRLRKSWRHV